MDQQKDRVQHDADQALLRMQNAAERRHPFGQRVGVFLKHGQIRPSAATICSVKLSVGGIGVPEAKVSFCVQLERTKTYRDVPEDQIVPL